MVRTAIPERSTAFLVRCNLELSTRLLEVADLISRPQHSFRIEIDELLGSTSDAIARIEHGDDLEGALEELWATLSRLEAVVVRDPGIIMARDDLYAAATALVSEESAEPAKDVRRWRLLREAHARLRDRLGTAQPNCLN